MIKLTSGFTKRLGVILILAAVIICLAFVSLDVSPDADSPDIALAAPQDGTYLASGTGPQFGPNVLRMTSGTDFYVSSGTASFENDAISIGAVGTEIATKMRLSLPNLDEAAKNGEVYSNITDTAAVGYALRDPDVEVTATFKATLQRVGNLTSAVKGQINLAYVTNNDGGMTLPSATADFAISSGSGDNVEITATIEFKFNDKKRAVYPVGAGSAFNASVNFTELAEADESKIEIVASSLELSSNSNTFTINYGAGVGIRVTGANRAPVSIPNIKNQQGRAELAKLYVKQGDIITVTLTVSSGNAAQEYDYTYAAAMNKTGDSCVDWHTFIEYDYGEKRTYLNRIRRAGGFYKPSGDYSDEEKQMLQEYYGYAATFEVLSGVGNAQFLSISPRIYGGINELGNYVYQQEPENPENYISIKVDNSAPASPEINPQSDIGMTINGNRWYTTSREVKLRYSSAVADDDTASEFVYAFILDKDITWSAVNFAGYDFTPSATAYPTDCPYNYIVGGEQKTAHRQQLGVNNDMPNDTNKNALRFDEAGEYALVLFTVDSAGNVSEPTLYSSLDNTPVKVDATFRAVGAHFYYDSQPYYPGMSAFRNFASVLVIGSAGHDESGNCIISPNLTQQSNILTSANNNLINVKRDSYVTVRIVMTSATGAQEASSQAYNYSLVRYSLGNSISVSNPTYVVNASGRYVYDVTFRMTDAIWNYVNDSGNQNDRPLAVTFHRRMKLELENPDFTYNPSQNSAVYSVSLTEDNFKLSFPNAPSDPIGVKPKIKVEYYERLAISVYARYTVVDGENKLATGGYLRVGNYQYDFGNTEDLLPYIEGQQKLVADGKSLVFYESAGRPTIVDANYALYTVYGYDENAKRTGGVKDAGTYYYYAAVNTTDTNIYYGEIFSSFVVKKTSPEVLNVTASGKEGNLIYGDSLDELVFKSTTSEETGLRPLTEKKELKNLGRTFYKSSLGVWGEYLISSPTPGTADYIKHAVQQNFTITVSFNPVNVSEFTLEQINEYYNVFFNEFVVLTRNDQGNVIAYELIEGKNTAKNFNQQLVYVEITIEHALAYIATEGDLRVTYDGNAKTVNGVVYKYVPVLDGDNNPTGTYSQVYIAPEPQTADGKVYSGEQKPRLIVEYKAAGEGEGSYTRVAPTVAGYYDVRISVDTSVSNYTADPITLTLQIDQRTLEVFVSETVSEAEHESLTSSANMAGYEYKDILKYTYGHLKTADFYSGFYTGETLNRVDSLMYSFRFQKIYNFNQSGEVILIPQAERVWTDPESIIASNSLEAGIYVLQVSIDNVNNRGSKYMQFRVSQAAVGSSSLIIRTPNILAPYTNVSLNGTDLGKSGNMEFGETLAEASEKIIGTGGSAKYTFAGSGKGSTVDVAGRFVFESEASYAQRNGIVYLDMPTNAAGDRILDVKFDASGNVDSYSVSLIWQAGSYDQDGHFIYNTNYLSYATEKEIKVVRATADFSNMKLSDITYGEGVGNATFSGIITSHGFVFNELDYVLSIAPEEQSRILNGGQNEIKCIFVPDESLARQYLTLYSVMIPVYVQKYEVEIEFTAATELEPEDFDGTSGHYGVTYIYGSSYANPAVTVKAYDEYLAMAPQFTYYRLATEGEAAAYLLAKEKAIAEGKEIEADENIREIDDVIYYKITAVDSSTPVGEYYVLAEIVSTNINYKGYALSEFYVIRAALNYAGGVIPPKSISYGDNISSVDFGAVTLIHGAKDFRGRFKVVVWDGYNECVEDYEPAVHLSSTPNVYLKFEPLPEYEEEYNANCRPYLKEYCLRVDKRDISGFIKVSGLSAVYDNNVKAVSVEIADDEDNTLDYPYVIEYEVENPRYAGSYAVTVSIADSVQNYRGSVTVTLVIDKSTITFNNPQITEFPYDAQEHAFVPAGQGSLAGFNYEAFEYNVTYAYFDGTPLYGIPSQIGSYKVHASVDDANFKGIFNGILNITQNLNEEEKFLGLNQTYSAAAGGIVPVTPNYNTIVIGDNEFAHPATDYTVRYYAYEENDEVSAEYTTSVPVNAGKYKAVVTFATVRGYAPAPYELTMIIEKAVAEFEPAARYERVYVGSSVSFAVTLPSGILAADYKYRALGSEDEFIAAAPVNAGLYEVQITLISNNYVGGANTVLEVLKATPEIRSLPMVQGIIPFGSLDSDVSFNAGSGRTIFLATGEELTGTYRLISEDLSERRVGRHTVRVGFTADKNVYGDNFNEAVEFIDIDVAKRDLSQFITFEDEFEKTEGVMVMTYSYRASAIALTPKLDSEAMADAGLTLPDGYNTIRFLVTYNGQSAAPSYVDTLGYAVKVNLDDDNFSGSLSNAKLVITKAEPILKLPSFRTIDKGDSITNDVIMSGSGYAYIMNGDERIIVSGSYSVYGAYLGMTVVANDNLIAVTFNPDETDLYVVVNAPAIITGNGKSVDLTSAGVITVSGEEAYGAPLKRFSITLNDKPAFGDLNAYAYGTIAWANPDAILDVGELAEYIYTPKADYLTSYNVIRGKVAVNINRNQFGPKQGYGAYVYDGDAIGTANVNLEMIFGEEGLPVTDFQITLASEGMGLTDRAYGFGQYLPGVELVITVSHPNFEEVTVRMPVYVYKKITEFTIQNDRKFYDGERVEISDMGITAGNTDYTIRDKDYRFESIILNGANVSEIREAGVYTVTVIIAEADDLNSGALHFGSHKGSFTFTYTVEKRDISEFVTVTGNDKTFADVERLRVNFGIYNAQVDINTVVVRYYDYVNLRDYGALPPTDAGSYKVTVSVSSLNPYFTASREFDYTIRKRQATVTLQPLYSREYNPAIPVDVVPDVSNNLTSDSYVVSFYKQGSSEPISDKPVEAGTYTVKVEIIHNNYKGSATSVLVIDKAGLEVAIVPTLDPIQYGVKVKSSGINGGRVVSYGGTQISGKFEFTDPENDKLPVGTNSVSLRFIPDNVNYSETYVSVIITVNKAYAGLAYDSLTATYDGTPKYPTFHTELKLLYSFTRGGYNVQNAVEAGDYVVTVRVNDANYEGEAVVKFTVLKASLIAEESVMPVAGSVEYGRALNNSFLSPGRMVYVRGGNPIVGAYSYVFEDTVLGKVGVYNDVPFVFVPQDSNNYESYVGYVDVEVTKATAVIYVTGNRFTYGDYITQPIFTTAPANMTVLNDERYADFALGGNAHAGSHQFTATISDDNYQGTLLYAVYIDKKDIGIAYYFENYIVDRYQFTYANASVVNPRVIASTIVGEDRAEDIQNMILCKYYPADAKNPVPTVTVPTAVGEYYALATLVHPDYSIDEDTARIPYVITRATVSSMVFDPDLLSNQIYGSVSVPAVITAPNNVSVRVEFPGFEYMPLAAGNYSIKAVVDDPNYMPTEVSAMFRINPKEILIENIKVQNKMYDGLPDVKVTGELGGVMVGDEVKLVMTAVTRDYKTDIGTYPVVITSYELSGLHAKNYKVYPPVYSLTVKISENKIVDPQTGSYITTPDGFSSNVTVSFSEVYDTVNKTNLFSAMFGQKATVQVIEVKENGINTVLSQKVKFYAKIPDKYLNARNLKVEGMGNLAGVNNFEREDDYITFYADSSGEIVFSTNDFPYWVVILIGAIVMVILGFVVILITAPIRKRKRISREARRIYGWENDKGSFEERYSRQVKAQEAERKRRWRM